MQEYIGFGSLLANPVLDNKFQLSFQTATEGQKPSFCFEPAARPKKIQTIDTWMHAFHIFVGIYTSKYPTEGPALMKYADIIQDLTARGHNWQYYDENFRFLRQSQASVYPWGNVHWELWLRSQQTPYKRTPSSLCLSSGKTGRTSTSIPRAFCYNYHKGNDVRKLYGTQRVSRCYQQFPGLMTKTKQKYKIISSRSSCCLPCVFNSKLSSTILVCLLFQLRLSIIY